MSDIHDWACIEDEHVVMVVRWDGLTVWPPAERYLMVDLTDHPRVGSGWTYRDGQFIDERPVVDEEVD